MSAPEVHKNKDHTLLNWKQEQLRIIVRRLRTHKDGRIMGEITITSDAPDFDNNHHLHWSEFNFSSITMRRDLARYLEEQYKDFRWKPILEQLCMEITHLARRGEEVKRISTAGDILPIEYLIDPIIPLRQPTVIFGDGGVGKSTLSLVLYITALLPWTDNPLGLITRDEASTQGLILDWEADENTVKRQLQCLERGLGLTALGVNYLPCSYAFADDLERIQKAISQVGTEFIIIDSLAAAVGGDLNASEPATRFYNALRGLGVTSLIIAHNPKGDGKKSIYGSGIFEHRARSVWECKGSQRPGENELYVKLVHRKTNISGLHKELGFKFIFGDDSIEVERQDTKDIAELRGNIKAQTRILGYLKEGPATAKDISNMLVDINPAYTRTALSRMRDKDLVVKHEGNKWGLRTEEQ